LLPPDATASKPLIDALHSAGPDEEESSAATVGLLPLLCDKHKRAELARYVWEWTSRGLGVAGIGMGSSAPERRPYGRARAGRTRWSNAVALADCPELGVCGRGGEVDERRGGVLELGDGHGSLERESAGEAGGGAREDRRLALGDEDQDGERLVEAQGSGERGGECAGGEQMPDAIARCRWAGRCPALVIERMFPLDPDGYEWVAGLGVQ
jgi:hypothetical protein